MGNKKKLTPKQRLFVAEYIKDYNATRAALAAGYKEKAAYRTGGENLHKPLIKAAIEEQIKAREKRTLVTADRVIAELARVGFANVEDFIAIQKDGSAYIDLSSMTRDQAAAVQEITVDEYVEGRGDDARPVKKVKLRFLDKIKALELLGRHLALFIDRHKVSGDEGEPPVQIEQLSSAERRERIQALIEKRQGD